jgi:sRNA-binding carbon storage regulator CsrA
VRIVEVLYGRRLAIAPGVYLRVERRTANIVGVAIAAPKEVSVRRGEDRRIAKPAAEKAARSPATGQPGALAGVGAEGGRSE